MAKTITSFKKGERLVGRQKGSLNKRTQIKEQIGLSSWAELSEKMLNEGANKVWQEIYKLKGKEYVMAYNTLLEYMKPKLARQEVKQEIVNKDPLGMSPDERKKELERIRERFKK